MYGLAVGMKNKRHERSARQGKEVSMSKPTVAFVLAAAAVMAPLSSAHAAFSGNVCGLLSTSEVATVHVTPLSCTARRPIKGPFSTSYSGNWGSTSTLAPHLTVFVVTFSNSTALQIARKNLAVSPYAHVKKVSGIGSSAYSSYSGVAAEVNFVSGDTTVTIVLRSSRALHSATPLTTLARVIAGKL
jgi:hypothetical protein